MMSHMRRITASTTVSEILNEHPELTDYLMEIGLCGCEFGPENTLGWELDQAAEDKGLELPALLNELNRRVQK